MSYSRKLSAISSVEDDASSPSPTYSPQNRSVFLKNYDLK